MAFIGVWPGPFGEMGTGHFSGFLGGNHHQLAN